MTEFLINLIKSNWYKPISLIIVPCLMILGGIPLFPLSDTASKAPICFYSLTTIFIYIIYTIKVYQFNKLPCVDNERIGILLIVNSENNKQFNDIKKKFIDKFALILKGNTETKFDTIYLQEERLRNFDVFNKELTIKLLKKVNCIYVAKIKILADDVDNSDKYEVTINNAVLHFKYIDNVNKRFISELNNVTNFINRTIFSNENKIEQLEVTAAQLVYVCEYIIGITYFLNNQFVESIQLMDRLYQEVNKIKSNINIINYLKNVMPRRCYEIHFLNALFSYSKYLNERNSEDLEDFKNELEYANSFLQNTYVYYLHKAIYYVCSSLNINKAKVCISECKKVIGNSVWKYSDAFLCACESRGFLNIYRKYKQAFKVDYNLASIVIFIENILEEYPDLYHLNFALGMVYSEIGDKILAEKNFNIFKSMCNINDDKKAQLDDIINERINCLVLIESV